MTYDVKYWYEFYKKSSFSELIRELCQIRKEVRAQGYKTMKTKGNNQIKAILLALEFRCFYGDRNMVKGNLSNL